MSFDDFKADTKLRLIPEIHLVLKGDKLVIKSGAKMVELRANMLVAVDLFRTPRSLREAMAILQAKTKLDWMAVSATILSIYRSGILVADAGRVGSWAKGFSLPCIHIRMLDDSVRTGFFLQAIKEVVQPGDVVVDLGTGTGVLAVAAAKAGAKKVYAIESTAIADAAELLIQANGCADRVELIRGLSTTVTLPERADVIVSEIIGNDPFDEHILPYMRDACARFLKPGGRILPQGLAVHLTPAKTDADFCSEHLFTAESAAWWNKLYGFQFEALQEVCPVDALQIHVLADRVKGFEPLGPPTKLLEVDLTQPPETVEAAAKIVSYEAAAVDSLVLHFDVLLTPDLCFSSDPWDEKSATSWGIPVWMLPTSRMVFPEQPLQVNYAFATKRASLSIGQGSDNSSGV